MPVLPMEPDAGADRGLQFAIDGMVKLNLTSSLVSKAVAP
jgi:hypothetical protein